MNAAVIVAGGAGSRMASETPKQLLKIAGRTVLEHALAAFEAARSIHAVVVVAPKDRVDAVRALTSGFAGVHDVVPGGARRQDSVRAGLSAVPDEAGIVAIHDAARPLIRPEEIDAVVAAAGESGAAVLATSVTDTVKQVEHGTVVRTLDRSGLWTVQTPQAFRLSLIREAHRDAAADGVSATDDTALIERLGQPVTVVPGRRDNLKITTAEDLAIAEHILERAAGARTTRTGLGYDVHRLVEGRPLILGGVTVPFNRGLLGHSDADVLSHAVVDALLGAAGLGDIGRLYPDTHAEWKGASSDIFLKGAAAKLREMGAGIVNVDAVIMAQKPKLAPFITEMEASIARALGLPAGRISVKATTTEGLGFVGTGEGMAAQAVATIHT